MARLQSISMSLACISKQITVITAIELCLIELIEITNMDSHGVSLIPWSWLVHKHRECEERTQQ